MHLFLNIPAVHPARQAGDNRFEGTFRTLADRTSGLAVVDGIENVHSKVDDTAATELLTRASGVQVEIPSPTLSSPAAASPRRI